MRTQPYVPSTGRIARRLGRGLVIAAVWILLPAIALAQSPRNVILFIGDGMGFEQVEAGGLYAHGAAGSLCFEAFPNRGQVTTRSASSSVTDSAAAATAMATGVKVTNGVISMAYPGDGGELLTLLEYFQARGKSGGLVTTTYVTHATPAAFGAHEPSRDLTAAIGSDYLEQTRPEILLGGGGNGLSPATASAAGYSVVSDAAGLLALDTENAAMVSGQFGTTYLPYEYDGVGTLPHLSQMTSAALRVLDNDPDGFFLMVEGGLIDQACHANDIRRAVNEVAEFERSVLAAIDWAAGRTDTLILVTADHETGGLTVTGGGAAGTYPTASWSTTGHTSANVPVFAMGPNAELVAGVLDNTYIFHIATHTTAVPGPATSPDPPDGATGVALNVTLRWTPGEGATSHEVLFGTADPLPLVSVQEGTSFDPGPLADGTSYLWRVDEVGSGGVVEGSTWSFATASACVPTTAFDSVVLGTARGSRNLKYGQATVTVADDCGRLLEGAVVSGHFTDSFAGEAPQTGTTDPAGQTTFTTTEALKRPRFSFVVDGVTFEGLVWAP